MCTYNIVNTPCVILTVIYFHDYAVNSKITMISLYPTQMYYFYNIKLSILSNKIISRIISKNHTLR